MNENNEPEDDLDREAVAEALTEMGLESAKQLADLVAACHQVVPINEAEQHHEGQRSRLGGVPDVPAGFQWPRHHGRPLSFLGQFDFYAEDVLLSFFYDCIDSPWGFSPEDRGAGKVFAFRESSLEPADMPDDLTDEFKFSPRDVALEPTAVMLNSRSAYMEAFDIPESDLKVLAKLELDLEESGEPLHHLFGHPFLVQGDMEFECQLASNGIDCGEPEGYDDPRVTDLEDGVDDWILLFQCDSDAKAGWHWGDSGRLFFWIKADDLANGDFDDVWVILQSH